MQQDSFDQSSGQDCKCQSCQSDRILHISAKTGDLLTLQMKDQEYDGYTPKTSVLTGNDFSAGYEDYLVLSVCLNCGQVQGEFPVEQIPELERSL